MPDLRISAVAGLPEIAAGAPLAALIARRAGDALTEPGTIVCIAQKLVSKAEGRVRRLAEIEPTTRALDWAAQHGGDPRHIQAVLDESAEVIRAERGVLIARTHHGFVCANAGVDQSNAAQADEVILLPADADASARRLRAELQRLSGTAPLAVLISDSFGRAWRHGQADVAIGLAGLRGTADYDGGSDRSGRALQATLPAIADEVAGAADLVRTKAGGEGVVLVRGLRRYVTTDDGPGATALARDRSEDLFGAR